MKRLSISAGSYLCTVVFALLLILLNYPIFGNWLLNRGNVDLLCILAKRDECLLLVVDRTISMYQRILLNPTRSNAEYALGILYNALGDSQSAAEMFSKSDRVLSAAELGWYYYKHGDKNLAIVEWKKAGYGQKFIADGTHEFAIGSYESSLDSFELGIAIQSDVPAYYFELMTELYLREGRADDAQDAWIRAYPADDSVSFRQMYLLGQIRQQQGNYLEADRAFDRAVKLFLPVESELQRSSLCIDIGNSYRSLGEFVRAEAWYDRALSIESKSQSMVLMAQGTNYQFQHRYSDAIDTFRQVVAISPNDAKARYLLGVSYTWQCRFDEAASEMEQAIEIQPGNGLYHFELGVVYNNLNRHDLADREVEIARSLGSLDLWRVKSMATSCH